MIRKYLIGTLVSICLTTAAFANSTTTVVNPAGFVNLLSGFNNSVYVSSIIITANTTNASANIIDTSTNSLTYVNPAYTNTISYATNYITSWTNFYGVAQSTTNIALVDLTNNVVLSSTNNFAVRAGVATTASTSTTYGNINSYFNNGIWATNTGSGIATITINYR